jgi:cytochrome oxidase Cu insertion factor (SCO1/SenC/PrrC family)
LPSIVLRNQDGHAFELTQTHGLALVLSFVYTRCTDRCALVAAKLAQVARRSDPHDVAVVALTVDPRYDTSARLRRYRGFFETPARWTIATGAPDAIVFLERRLGVEPQTRGAGRIDHNDIVIVADPRGRIARVESGDTWTPEQLAAAADGATGKRTPPLLAVELWLADAAARCGRGIVSFDTPLAFAIIVALALLVGDPLARALREPTQ